jgi:hypothetical protein
VFENKVCATSDDFTDDKNLMQGAVWTSEETAFQFAYDECIETSYWEDIARDMQTSSLITIGSLSGQYWPEYEAWACWQEHKCLSRIPHTLGDAMCYVYNEIEKKWYPWGLHSKVLQCSADNPTLT